MENRRRFIKQWSFRLLDKRVTDGAALMHYTGEAERQDAAELGVQGNSIVLPLGLDLSAYKAMPATHEFSCEYSQARDRTLIVFLSRLDPVKGLDLLLPAFAQLHAAHPNTLLVLAGEGETAFVQTLHAQAAQLDIAEDILWTGFVSGQAKLKLLAAADIYVLPSYSENFGIAAMEAMAAGAPTIISDQVGFAPDAAQRRAALTVPCKIEELAGALIHLSENKKEREQLGEQGRRLAHDKYSIEAMGSALIAQYQQIMQAKL
jgi:glycosyltransferase involved in cell wall biosynthesis